MDIFTVILIVYAIGYLLNKIFSKKSSQNQSYNLTDTQLNFRKTMARSSSDDQLKELLERHLTPEELKFIEMHKYIHQNQRPFRFSEWLYWTVEAKFLLTYSIAISMVLGWIILPFFFGVQIFPIISFWAFIYVDVILYL